MAVRPKKNSKGEIIPGHFIIDWRPDGKKGKRERLEYIGTDVAARQYEADLKRGFKQSVATRMHPQIVELLPEFIAEYKVNVSAGTIEDFWYAWKRLEPHFGLVRANALTASQVELYKASRLEAGVKKRTINRELTYLNAVINWAEDRKLIDPLPFRIKHFRKRDAAAPIPVIHTTNEIQKILDHIKPNARPIALLLYDAGLRKTEACTLKGNQVDLAAAVIYVKGKGGKERMVPIMTARLHQALAEAKAASGDGHLFISARTGQPPKSIKGALLGAAKRAGIDKRIYPHLLRHDHGSHAAMAGVDPRAVQKMLGHSDLKTTEIYTHLAGEFLKSEGQKFRAFLDSSQEKEKA